MFALLIRILLALWSVSEAHVSREAEILVLRQQLLVLSRKSRARVRLRNLDRPVRSIYRTLQARRLGGRATARLILAFAGFSQPGAGARGKGALSS